MIASQPAWQPQYARREPRMRGSDIRELLKLLKRPEVISFAGGIPDAQLLPIQRTRAVMDRILADPETSREALQYSASEGHPPLRNWIADHMRRLGVACGEDNILITCGSQQALEFLGRLFITPGDTVLTEGPTYLGALQAFAPNEPVYDTALGEGSNVTPEACRQAAAQAGGRVSLAYLVPDFANPTGRTMSRKARLEHIALARELGVPLIEDAAYTALRYDGANESSLLALDIETCSDIDRSCIIYCGTFSKVISPGMRVGWIVAAAPIVEKLVLIKQASDLNSPLINQMCIHALAETAFDDLAERARSTYRTRRNAMLSALAEHFGGDARWTEPDGGLFVWMTLDDRVDASALLKVALDHHNVAFVPGAGFYPGDGGVNKLRLSFSQSTPEQIGDGIARIAAAYRELMQRKSRLT
jgi:DNA-binding transcriptional MocR family regulator